MDPLFDFVIQYAGLIAGALVAVLLAMLKRIHNDINGLQARVADVLEALNTFKMHVAENYIRERRALPPCDYPKPGRREDDNDKT